MKEKELKKHKCNAKQVFGLEDEYSTWEILEIIVMNDPKQLDKLRARWSQLRSANDQYVKEIESGDKKRIHIAMENLARPQK